MLGSLLQFGSEFDNNNTLYMRTCIQLCTPYWMHGKFPIQRISSWNFCWGTPGWGNSLALYRFQILANMTDLLHVVLLSGYQCFRGTCCVLLQGLNMVSNHVQEHTMSQSGRPQFGLLRYVFEG